MNVQCMKQFPLLAALFKIVFVESSSPVRLRGSSAPANVSLRWDLKKASVTPQGPRASQEV